MRKSVKYAAFAVLGVGLIATGAIAQGIVHNQQGMDKAPLASSVMVPAGSDTYYISGSAGKGANTEEQTAATLEGLKGQLTKLGLTFGDVVQAHVFLVTDPAKGDIDFAGLNSEWAKRFGTATQPNRPSRVAIHVGLPTPGALVEIELVAAKKAQ